MPNTIVAAVVLLLFTGSCSFDAASTGMETQEVIRARTASNDLRSPMTAPPVPHRPVQNPFPRIPTPLAVQDFAPASHVGPAEPSADGDPIVVVLHGNYDRPEWQCEMWGEVADFYGWILCPRGIPTPWAARSEDRWMYKGSPAVSREIEAGLNALKSQYPGAVRTEGAVLVGFSLGAALAPRIVLSAPGRYAYLYLIEGGAAKLTADLVRALKKAGIRGIGLAMSTSKNRTAAQTALKILKKQHLTSVYVDMTGAGHNYRDDFSVTGRESLRTLVAAAAQDEDTAQ